MEKTIECLSCLWDFFSVAFTSAALPALGNESTGWNVWICMPFRGGFSPGFSEEQMGPLSFLVSVVSLVYTIWLNFRLLASWRLTFWNVDFCRGLGWSRSWMPKTKNWLSLELLTLYNLGFQLRAMSLSGSLAQNRLRISSRSLLLVCH